MSTPKDKPQEQHAVDPLAEETSTDLEVKDEEADKVGGGRDRRKTGLDQLQKNLDIVRGMNPQI